MEGPRVAIRIIGISPTSHGFAFSVTEGPEKLVDWGRCGIGDSEMLVHRLDRLIVHNRPLFVASEFERNKRSRRGTQFNAALRKVCARYGIMILGVERQVAYTPRRGHRPVTNYQIAQVVADRFRSIANKLPRPRQSWDGSDDRLGILVAAELASAGWRHFRSSH